MAGDGRLSSEHRKKDRGRRDAQKTAAVQPRIAMPNNCLPDRSPLGHRTRSHTKPRWRSEFRFKSEVAPLVGCMMNGPLAIPERR
jgi:hypothetical protein